MNTNEAVREIEETEAKLAALRAKLLVRKGWYLCSRRHGPVAVESGVYLGESFRGDETGRIADGPGQHCYVDREDWYIAYVDDGTRGY